MALDLREGTVLESLSFEDRGESSNNRPTVLSCGGIYIPQRTIPTQIKKWRQIINLPNSELSAKIFGFEPPQNDLGILSRKDGLN